MPSSAERLVNSTGFMLLRVADHVRDATERALAEWGLRGKDLRVLALVEAGEHPLSQQDLTALAGLDRTTMVGVVDLLEERGYAHRERSATDRRKHVVTVTPEGPAVLHKALGKLDRLETELLTTLTPDERAGLNDLVGRVFAAHDPSCMRFSARAQFRHLA